MGGYLLALVATTCVAATYLPADEDARLATYVAVTDGTGLRRIAAEGWPAWCPDGKQLILVTTDSVDRVNPDDGSRVRLFQHTGCAGIRYPSVSPTGRYLAATVHAGGRRGLAGGLRIWNLVTQKVVYTDWIFEDSSPQGCGSFSRPLYVWHPSRNDLAYIRFHDNAAENRSGPSFRRLRVWSSPPNTPVAVFDLPVPLSSVSWSPDGDELLFSAKNRLWRMARAKGAASARKTNTPADDWSVVALRSPADAVWLGPELQFRTMSGERLGPTLPNGRYDLLWTGASGEVLLGREDELVDVYRGQVGAPWSGFQRVCGLRTLNPWISVSRNGQRVAWTVDQGVWEHYPESYP